MPTWKYDATETSRKQFIVDDRNIVLTGGQTVTSEGFFLADQGLTLMSDNPAWNPLVGRGVVEAAGAEDVSVDIDADTNHVRLYGATDGITIDAFIHSKADGNKVVDGFSTANLSARVETKQRVAILVLSFSGAGNVTLEQWSE